MEQKDTNYFDPLLPKENWKCDICGTTIAGGIKRCPICFNNNPNAEVVEEQKKILSWQRFHGVSPVRTGTRRARPRC